MAEPSKHDIAEALISRHGRAYSQKAGINLSSGTPSVLFRWLCASLLFSARISNEIATAAVRALAKEGWTTAQKTRASTWEQRARTLNLSGYARYDERTSSMLGDVAEMLIDRYGRDLRRLREAAQRDPARERDLLKEFKGIGEVGADIFFREIQAIWEGVAPFGDQRALKAAARLGLGDNPAALARLVDRSDLPKLITALVRVDLAKDHEAVLEQAA